MSKRKSEQTEWDPVEQERNVRQKVKEDRELVDRVIEKPLLYKGLLNVRVEEGVAYLHYTKMEKDLDILTWIPVEAEMTNWTKGVYTKASNDTLVIETSVVKGDLSKVLEKQFFDEIEVKDIEEMSTFAKKLKQIMMNYPHTQYKTNSSYLNYLSRFFIEKGISKDKMKRATDHVISRSIDSTFYKDYDTPGQKAQAYLLDSTHKKVSTIRKELKKDLDVIENPSYGEAVDMVSEFKYVPPPKDK